MIQYIFVCIVALYFPAAQAAEAEANTADASALQVEFTAAAGQIAGGTIAALPMQHAGRLKPLDSLARETLLYLTGSRSRWGLTPVQMYLGLIVYERSADLQLIEIRSAGIRAELGLPKDRRYFSVNELEQLGIDGRAGPLLEKERMNRRALSEEDKHIVEVYGQLSLARSALAGEQFLSGVDFSFLDSSHGKGGPSEVVDAAKRYLGLLASGSSEASAAAADLIQRVKAQAMPPLFERYLDKMEVEVWFNRARLFLWAAALYLIAGFVLLYFQKLAALLVLPVALHCAGIAMRVYITGFAPVTNMYGTMIWVALGVALFSAVLYGLYRKASIVGFLILGSGFTLLLTEGFPLVLSPDMDPVVAVLRSNFWLTIHVLTITISYAAFTICMLLGNYALVRGFFVNPIHDRLLKDLSHATYRMAQLGVFLLTAGIILGGVWADYSWGRFWGWDPKETWALIADMGFLVILHARYIGWLSPFGVLAASPVAYLLVVMAWYGVNFILAAGLHSYGFSSGGLALVVGFVSLQALLLISAVAWRRNQWRRPWRKSEIGNG